MTQLAWEEQFRAVYDRAVAAYERGAETPERCIAAADRPFLASIGCTPQELFDFAEDAIGYGVPSFADVLEVTRMQREQFLTVLGGKPTGEARSASEFPAKADAIDGIAWLPRILRKAEAKLRGELPSELMYGCGGDRGFLAGFGIGLPEFLAVVRDARGNDRAVIDFVKSRRKR